ncbi:hypothetical protein [Bradyrhizobium sp. LA2.1]|uniref:hypothetical protein n=1 Tax=Bradyrhizobium sp. LA2.1 TaxID=3156376 RepID=UPI0033970A5C
MTRPRTPDEQLPPVARRFSQERVRADRVSVRIARAVAEAIKESGRSREEIAEEMSNYLGEKVTADVLYQYSSPANERSNIPAHRLIALLAVTGDDRLINAAVQDTPFIAISNRFEPLIQREIAREEIARLKSLEEEADAKWRASK